MRGPGTLTVLLCVLAHPLWYMTRMKKCPRPPGRLQPSGRKETGGALTWKVKWRSWRSKVVFSGTAGGSVDPKGKVGHWSAWLNTTKEGSEEVKGTENEKEGSKMEVGAAIPGMQPSSNETDGGFIMCEVEDRQEASVEVQGPKKKSCTCGI